MQVIGIARWQMYSGHYCGQYGRSCRYHCCSGWRNGYRDGCRDGGEARLRGGHAHRCSGRKCRVGNGQWLWLWLWHWFSCGFGDCFFDWIGLRLRLRWGGIYLGCGWLYQSGQYLCRYHPLCSAHQQPTLQCPHKSDMHRDYSCGDDDVTAQWFLNGLCMPCQGQH